MNSKILALITRSQVTRGQVALLLVAAILLATAMCSGVASIVYERSLVRLSLGETSQAFHQAFLLFVWSCLGFGSCCIGAVIILARRSDALRGLARQDSLTGLQNRATFKETLTRLLQNPGSALEVALMLLDVDRFKEINDTLGHAAGDELLKRIARRLETLPKAGISIARLGGDEFAIIVSARSAYRDATNMAGAIAKLTEEPFYLEGKPIRVNMSIGIASAPMEWCDADALLKHADIALYHAKAAGRGAYRFFNPKMYRELESRRELEDDLRHAVERGELDVYFQPIVDLKSKAVVSCEALARWRHPRHGFVPPMRFIALAEEIDLIQQIGNWIFERACAIAQTWPKDIRVSINLSPYQFDGHGLVAAVARIIGDTGISPHRIELEITETTLLRDNSHVRQVLANLKALGVRIALDDFGTGYSSLSYLHQFPIDKIKIDQSFVRDISSKPEAAAIIESINLLASKLGLVTTAEGVETEDHTILLRELGCNEGQGYYFDKPLPAETCLARLGLTAGAKSAA
jgi:diguanylate cyclase (GGDEF)-like protein